MEHLSTSVRQTCLVAEGLDWEDLGVKPLDYLVLVFVSLSSPDSSIRFDIYLQKHGVNIRETTCLNSLEIFKLIQDPNQYQWDVCSGRWLLHSLIKHGN